MDAFLNPVYQGIFFYKIRLPSLDNLLSGISKTVRVTATL